jgi:protein gp37
LEQGFATAASFQGALAAALAWNRAAERAGQARRVFCGSLCDIMEDRRDLDAERERLYGLIDRTLWLDWLLLTKRPMNYIRLLPAHWLEEPRKNVWLLTTVERLDYLWRIGKLCIRLRRFMA